MILLQEKQKDQHGNNFLFRIKCETTLRGVSPLNHLSASEEAWGASTGFQFLMEIVGDAEPAAPSWSY